MTIKCGSTYTGLSGHILHRRVIDAQFLVTLQGGIQDILTGSFTAYTALVGLEDLVQGACSGDVGSEWIKQGDTSQIHCWYNQ